MLAIFLLIVTTISVWYPILHFWFFQSWEQSWFLGNCGGGIVNFICLIQGHALLYFINYKLFGWNASGWYATTLILHVIAVLLAYLIAKKLLKNPFLGFITALLFSANSTYHDVLTWGSFNGLYAAMLVLFLSSILLYMKFSEEKTWKKILWYLPIPFLFALGLFIRESALLLPLFIGFFDITQYYKKFSWRYVKKLLYIFAPMIVLIIVYFMYKHFYGAGSYDYIDDSVQFRIALLSQKRYLEYTWRTLLMIGLFSAPHIIPYTLLNTARDTIATNIASKRYYFFFPTIGFAYIGAQLGLIWYYWKNKNIRRILLFAFLFFILPSIMACLVFTFKDDTMVKAYNLNIPPRYRYFAFFGTALFWVTLVSYWYKKLQVKFPQKKLLIAGSIFLITAGYFFYNIKIIRTEEEVMYATDYKPEKEFYIKFQSLYKTLPKDYIFYIYPGSGSLKDYMAEWHHIRLAYYPYLQQDRGTTWVENHIGMLLDRLEGGNGSLNSTFFIDYNTHGLIDRTQEARNIIRNITSYSYTPNILLDTTNASASMPLKPALHVEIPYRLTFSATSNLLDTTTDDFTNYQQEYLDLHKQAKVTACGTAPMGGVPGKYAMFLDPSNLIDGNLGRKSLWVADCRPAWVQVELGSDKTVSGFAFHTIQNGDVPTNYIIQTSLDGNHWTNQIEKNNNTSFEGIDLFNSPQKARFVRLFVTNTLQGSMLTLDEVEVLGENGAKLAKQYSSYEKLYFDRIAKGGAYLKVSWQTTPDTQESLITNHVYIPLEQDQSSYTFNINDNEHFDEGDEFLRRVISGITFESVGKQVQINIQNITFTPRFTLQKE